MQDVAGPQHDEVRGTKQEQADDAADIRRDEGAVGAFGAAEHHRETHAEQQREQGPELALHEGVEAPAGGVVDPDNEGSTPEPRKVIGRVNHSTFIRKMPIKAKPRTMSRAWMRSLVGTGASAAALARLATSSMEFPRVGGDTIGAQGRRRAMCLTST